MANRTFEQILSSDYHVSLEDNRHDESIKLAAEKYAGQFKAQTNPDKFEDFLNSELTVLGISDKKTIERVAWYYKTYFKAQEQKSVNDNEIYNVVNSLCNEGFLNNEIHFSDAYDEIKKILQSIQKPITDEEIEALAEKEYPLMNGSSDTAAQWNDRAVVARKAYIKGFKAALKPDGNQNLIDALTKINQMSDCGSPEATIIRMKEIASEALKSK